MGSCMLQSKDKRNLLEIGAEVFFFFFGSGSKKGMETSLGYKILLTYVPRD